MELKINGLGGGYFELFSEAWRDITVVIESVMDAHITHKKPRPKDKSLFIKGWTSSSNVKSKVTNFLWKLTPLTNQAEIEARRRYIKTFSETKKFNEHMRDKFFQFPMVHALLQAYEQQLQWLVLLPLTVEEMAQ